MPIYRVDVGQQPCPREQHRGTVSAAVISKRKVVKTPYKLKTISTFGEVEIMTRLGEIPLLSVGLRPSSFQGSPISNLFRHQLPSSKSALPCTAPPSRDALIYTVSLYFISSCVLGMGVQKQERKRNLHFRMY